MTELSASSEAEMLTIGAHIAAHIQNGSVVYLQGPLGAGKTTLVRGFLQALGQKGAVKSPTYTLVESYELKEFTIYHLDLYRLGDPTELEFIGARDYFDGNNICMVEWPERGQGLLPEADLTIQIDYAGDGRRLKLIAATQLGESLIAKV